MKLRLLAVIMTLMLLFIVSDIGLHEMNKPSNVGFYGGFLILVGVVIAGVIILPAILFQKRKVTHDVSPQ